VRWSTFLSLLFLVLYFVPRREIRLVGAGLLLLLLAVGIG
jgi:hypothetical protein